MANETIFDEEQRTTAAWQLYKKVLAHDILYCRELYNILKNLLKCRFPRHTFSFLDLGCGDACFVSEALKYSNVYMYMGVDTSSVALRHAKEHLAWIKHKKLIKQDLCQVVSKLNQSVDVAFSGFSLHYLSNKQKDTLLKHVYKITKPGGYFVIVDVQKNPSKPNNQWVKEFYLLLNSRLNLTKSERQHLLMHLQRADFSSGEVSYKHLATTAGWDHFTVLFDKAFVSFMVLSKY